jgi:hypothetical protein
MEGLLLKILHLLATTAVRHTNGGRPSDLIATARWDADGIGRGRPPYK